MTIYFKRICLIYCFAVLVLVLQTSSIFAAADSGLASMLAAAQQGGRYEQISESEWHQSESLFFRLLNAEPVAALLADVDQLGFRLSEIHVNGSPYVVLMEKEDARKGRGFYLFRRDASSADVLMIPHAYYDLHTATIGMQLGLQGSFAAIAWNTVHRYRSKNNAPSKAGNRGMADAERDDMWDMARLSNTCFTAFATAFAKKYETGRLLQIHGFSQKKRSTSKGRNADIILSPGAVSSVLPLTEYGDCMKLELPVVVNIYGSDVDELGGTRNVVGQLLRSLGHGGFLHMEMSKSLRVLLKDNPDMRQAFLHCL